MDQNTPSANPSQTDAPVPTESQQATPSVSVPAQQPAPEPAPVQPETQTAVQSDTQAPGYTENVGEAVVSLLDEVNSDEKLLNIVADEMRMDAAKVKSILEPLLNKIDQKQLTLDELSLIMAVSVVDEPPQS